MSELDGKIAQIKYLKEMTDEVDRKLKEAMNLNDLGIFGREDVSIGSIHLVGDVDHTATVSQKKLKCKIHRITFTGSTVYVEYYKIKVNGDLCGSTYRGYFNTKGVINE